MDQGNPTAESSGASTLERLQSYLTADDSPNDAQPSNEHEEADAPLETPRTDAVDETEQSSESPEYQLTDIAKLLGADESALDVDEEGNVLVKTKIDGQEGKAKFQDLLKSYQLQGHVDKQVREAAEMRKAVEAQSQALQQQMAIQSQLSDHIAEIKAIDRELAQFSNVDWSAAFDQDHVAAAKADKYMRDLQAARQNKVAEAQQAEYGLQQHQMGLMQQKLQMETQALFQALPGWSKPEVAQKEKEMISSDLISRGFTQQEVGSLSDHRLLILAREAALYRQSQTKQGATEKVVRAAPKIIKPGSSQPSNRAVNNIKNIKAEVKKTGSRESVVNYLLAAGKV
jgi:hypothetical protein